MKTKRMILSVSLVLALIVNPILPPAQTTALAESILTLTIEDTTLYEALKKCLSTISSNKDALQSSDDEKKQMTLNPDNVIRIDMTLNQNITGDNFKNTLETLFLKCTNMKYLRLKNCDLSNIDCSIIDNRTSLENLAFVDCKLDMIPDLTLPNLVTLCLSKNNLSADGVCDSLNKTKLPALTHLWLDDCEISNIDFIQNLGNLQSLSLADNRLTDDSISALASMTNLSDLKELNLGVRVHIVLGGSYAYNVYIPSKNTFTDYTALASLLVRFPKLTELELSGLRITSIQAFTSINTTAKIVFDMNYISDYTGLTADNNFDLTRQTIYQYGDFAGQEIDVPETMKRILNSNDILYSSEDLTYKNCYLSDDKTKIVIEKMNASVTVNNGKLSDTIFYFMEKLTPSYTVPNNLTATVGDTLASVALPEGFSWKEPEQTLEEEGSYTFKAVYTPSDTDKYNIVDNINIQVKVIAKPTPTLETSPTSEPALTPEPSPTQEPTLTLEPSPTSEPTLTLEPSPTSEPTLTPEPSPTSEPTLTPEPSPTSEPTLTPKPSPISEPTLTPKPSPTSELSLTPKPSPTSEPTLTPEPSPTSELSLTPEAPTPTPLIMTSTPKPDESKLTGNQIEKRTDLPCLLATGKQKGENSIKLTWNKWSGCSGYEVYWSYCDGKQNFKKLKTVKRNGKRVCVHNKLQKNRAYKYYIATYKKKNGRKNYLSKSFVIHVAMRQEMHTNVKKIKLNKTKLVLKPKKKFKIKATTVLENNKKKVLAHEPKIRYYTGNKEVATVTKKGVIKAKKQGTCTIYVIANNGVSKTIKLTVK